MALDATTESIAHFVGLFEIATETDRLRQAYKEFELKEPQPESLGELGPLSVRLKAPHELEPYHPGLTYEPVADAGPGSPGSLPPGGRPPFPDLTPPELQLARNVEGPFSFRDIDARFLFWGEPLDAAVELAFRVPLPSSLSAYTWQSAILQDDDIFSLSAAAFDTAGLHEIFARIVEDTSSLMTFELPSAFADDWALFAEEAIAEVRAPKTPVAADNLEAHVKRGAEATGVFVDGERADALAPWSDHLPDYFQSGDQPEEREQDETTGQGSASGSATDGVAMDGGASGAGSGSPGKHGTEAEIAAPLESGEIEKAFSRAFESVGDDGFEQSSPPLSGHKVLAGANTALNEVAIKSGWLDAPLFVVRGDVVKVEAVGQLNVLVENDEVPAGDAGPPSRVMNAAEIVSTSSGKGDAEPGDVLPQNWHVTRITGDLVQVNWVEQKTLATDFDRAVFETTGSSLHLALGENEFVNAASFAELGHSYDVIFVAEDMIDVTMVTQTNVLFDSDRITAAPGNAIASSAAEIRTAPGDSGAVSAADNLLYNQAVLKTTGIDEIVEMGASFAKAAEELAAGAETLAREVAQDAVFKGTELLRALHIDGSFVTANVLKQANLIADADRIHQEVQALRDDMQAQIVAGSNVLANIASIEKFGIDSKIMAAGQKYQEAMLYQAELIERDALPVGVGLQPLANEAIAFLADGMITPEKAEDLGQAAPDAEMPGAVDLMQTMLS